MGSNTANILGCSPEMALKLSKVLRRSPESWMAMQDNYDLNQARQTLDLDNYDAIKFAVWELSDEQTYRFKLR